MVMKDESQPKRLNIQAGTVRLKKGVFEMVQLSTRNFVPKKKQKITT